MKRAQRRPAARGPPPKAPGRRPVEEEDPILSDSDDEEIDADVFKTKKDKISLNMSDDEEGDDDSLDAEGVYDLDDDEDEDEDDDDDVDALYQEAIKHGKGSEAELARHAKALGQKLKLQRGESDEESEEEEAGPGRRRSGGDDDEDIALWGANKRNYYDAEDADDEETRKMEEEEALRLQRARAAKLDAADFGLEDEEEGEDEEDDSEEEEQEETMGGLAAGGSKQQKGKAAAGKGGKAGAAAGGVHVEQVARADLGSLGDEAARGALLADAPELLALLGDLQDSLGEVRHRVAPLLTEVRDGGLATAEGLSYLEAKHLLLLSYCTHIVFYLLLKAEGRPVRDHPVITRLVELRAYLEKIRPIDKQLSYQIDKLLKAAAMASSSGNGQRPAAAAADGDAAGPGPGSAAEAAAALDGDALRYGPRPDALVPKVKSKAPLGAEDGAEDGGAPGVYRPPRINPVSMELDEKREAGPLSTQDRRRIKELKAKAGRSDTLRALAAELAGAPEEERLAVAGLDTTALLRTRAKLEARSAVEEDNFTRVRLGKDEVKKLRAQRRAGFSGAGMLEDFGDEVADLVDISRGAGGDDGSDPRVGARGNALNDLFARQKVSQRFGADHPSLTKRPIGGDEDLPRREPLNERRAKFDAAAARKLAQAGGSEDGEEYDLGGAAKGRGKRRGGEEDDFYAQAKVDAEARKKARSDAHRAPALAPPAPDPRVEGARAITDAIQRNRGLTPHRRRDQKNPRKANRMKFEKAQVRIKGAVQAVRKPEAVAYGGEATGIKAKVSKSRKL